MTGKIFIESKDITYGLNTGYNHAYLVYEDGLGNEFVIRGGPETDKIWNPGKIVIEPGVPISRSEDRRPKDQAESRGRRELDLGGRDASVVWEQMKGEAGRLNDKEFRYRMMGEEGSYGLLEGDARNSNSVVASILSMVGLDILLPSNTSEDELPGIGNKLPPYDNDDFYVPPLNSSLRAGEWEMAERTNPVKRLDPAQLLGPIFDAKASGRPWRTSQMIFATVSVLAQALAQSRREQMERSMWEVVTGGQGERVLKNMERGGTPPFNPGGGGQVNMLDMLTYVVDRSIGAAMGRERQRTMTMETERSREAVSNWKISRSQMNALMAEAAQRGIRNL